MSVMLVDAATLYYRAFYALPASLADRQGRPHNAIRGFFDGLRTLRDAHSPAQIVACWDDDWRPQWRVDLVPSYKTHRLADEGDELVPDELSPQVEVIAEACQALGIPVVGQPEMEADDVIAALALNSTEPVDIVSGDRDLIQLVNDAAQRRLLYLGTGVGAHTIIDDAYVLAKYGIRSDQYADFATLRGDPSDGIPGARGIGEKTAAALLTAFGDIDGIIAAAEQALPPLTKAKAARLLEDAASLRAMRRVVALRPATISIPDTLPDLAKAEAIFGEVNLSSVLKRWIG